MPARPSRRGHRTRLCATPRWRKPTLAHRIVLKDVDAGYGAVRVLHRVSLEVHEGETVVLLGTNGNGKSTLMKCLMGLVQVDAGEVFLETNGQCIDLRGKAPEAIVNLGSAPGPGGRRRCSPLPPPLCPPPKFSWWMSPRWDWRPSWSAG